MHTIVHIDHDEGRRRAIGAFPTAQAASDWLIAANSAIHAKYPTCLVESDDTLLDEDSDGVMLSVFVMPVHPMPGQGALAEYHVVHVDEADFANL